VPNSIENFYTADSDLYEPTDVQKIKTKMIMSFTGNKVCTVWKFHNFSITQILHEINFGESKSSKTAGFAILGAVKFVDLAIFSLQKVQKFIKIKIQNISIC